MVIVTPTWLGNKRLKQLCKKSASLNGLRLQAAGQASHYKRKQTLSPEGPLSTRFQGHLVSTSLGTMPTDLENAMNSFIEVYHNYSLPQGNYHALYRDDLKKMLTKECPHYLKEKDADTWFKELDVNSDKAINFEEFLALMIKLGVAAHEDSHKK